MINVGVFIFFLVLNTRAFSSDACTQLFQISGEQKGLAILEKVEQFKKLRNSFSELAENEKQSIDLWIRNSNLNILKSNEILDETNFKKVIDLLYYSLSTNMNSVAKRFAFYNLRTLLQEEDSIKFTILGKRFDSAKLQNTNWLQNTSLFENLSNAIRELKIVKFTAYQTAVIIVTSKIVREYLKDKDKDKDLHLMSTIVSLYQKVFSNEKIDFKMIARIAILRRETDEGCCGGSCSGCLIRTSRVAKELKKDYTLPQALKVVKDQYDIEFLLTYVALEFQILELFDSSNSF